MKATIVSAVITLAVIAVLGGIVVQKERLLSRGDRVLLKLAPRDPRSLMQGDYMRLRYDLAVSLEDALNKVNDESRSGIAIIGMDERGVGVRVRMGTRPGPGEKIIRYKHLDGEISFGAESFFFQEGEARKYESAQYGELVVDDSGSSVLVGLRDKDLKALSEE
jgi:uncharacterized membrane-anchored protein